MKLQGTVEHCQASLRHQTQGRVRTGSLGLRIHRIAQGRTGPALHAGVPVGYGGSCDRCGYEHNLLVASGAV